MRPNSCNDLPTDTTDVGEEDVEDDLEEQEEEDTLGLFSRS